MISLLVIAIVSVFVGYMIAHSPIVDRALDRLVDVMIDWFESKTVVDNVRVSAGQGNKHDRTKEELVSR